MKKCLLFLFLIIANVNLVYSQIIAGSSASGLIISNPAVSFSVTSFTSDSRFFDLDCDGIEDMSVELHKGPTFIDASNNANVHILSPGFQICADTANWQPRNAHYFNSGDTIVCPATTNWYNDMNIQLGNCGCMDCPGPCSATDLYLGYKNISTSQIGWIKVSFNLFDGGGSTVPITLSVPEVLSPCVTTSITPVPTYTSSGIATCGIFTYNYMTYSTSCPGNCDGGVAITNITGGTPAYFCFWSMGIIGQSVSNICEGGYMFNITDAVGNTCTANFLVSDPAPMTFSLSSTNILCYGAVDATVCCTNLMGGNPPYAYSWTAGGGSMACSNSLSAGNYGLSVTDGNGCVAVGSVTVNQPSPLIVSQLTYSNVSCFGGVDGSACAFVNGGTTPYVYSWSNGNTSSCNTNLVALNYSLCVIDINGCQVCSTVAINEPSAIQITESITQASCISCCDGNAQLQISGGTPPYSTVYTNTPTCPGVYGYTVTDANGCVFTDSVLISYPTSLAGQSFETMFDVFPNPGNGNFEIRNINTGVSNVNIKVVDIYGKCVLAKTAELRDQSLQLNLNTADGIYFLHITEKSGDKEFVKKIIVLK